MKKFLIGVSTVWPHTSDVYRGLAEDISSLRKTAQALAYDCFQLNGGIDKMLEESGLKYTPENLERCKDLSPTMYDYTIDNFSGTEEEWESIGGEVYYGS